ncbi:hypothetical protein EGW08_001336 [Elysia chlorotica]|uniref:Uncharacterized protein n=1 Tax=Elysia chlorotica TaxID=188477 RepID=A0A433UAU2_ELYCH|nr:hypothetical protein EGW08_001336 [Elysia chlorotica]
MYSRVLTTMLAQACEALGLSYAGCQMVSPWSPPGQGPARANMERHPRSHANQSTQGDDMYSARLELKEGCFLACLPVESGSERMTGRCWGDGRDIWQRHLTDTLETAADGDWVPGFLSNPPETKKRKVLEGRIQTTDSQIKTPMEFTPSFRGYTDGQWRLHLAGNGQAKTNQSHGQTGMDASPGLQPADDHVLFSSDTRDEAGKRLRLTGSFSGTPVQRLCVNAAEATSLVLVFSP